jgi:hypothetical protein
VQDHFFFVAGGLTDARSFESDAAITIASKKFNPLGEFSGSIGKNRGCFGGALCGERVGSLAAYVDGAAAWPGRWSGAGVGLGFCALAAAAVRSIAKAARRSVFARWLTGYLPIQVTGSIRFWIAGGANQGFAFVDERAVGSRLHFGPGWKNPGAKARFKCECVLGWTEVQLPC